MTSRPEWWEEETEGLGLAESSWLPEESATGMRSSRSLSLLLFPITIAVDLSSPIIKFAEFCSNCKVCNPHLNWSCSYCSSSMNWLSWGERKWWNERDGCFNLAKSVPNLLVAFPFLSFFLKKINFIYFGLFLFLVWLHSLRREATSLVTSGTITSYPG